ncbi:MAG TPA: TatD family hydrolase [Candidatus Avacidaminococcus intestinavium]|uniref:TatD family hydrolase n=1 Tax=Candidatus Avacidaminococcus intestinavium TaxID=2840684 RepID=A0A9D1MQX3_9FIRM|nr:TatD family hydrolase [Candidatus Avacidaminococcus intestinavium]
MAKVFDSHAHLDAEQFDEDRELLFSELKEKISGMVNPGCDTESSYKAISYAEKYAFVYAAVGWHPQEVARMTDDDLTLLLELTKHPKVVAIGEIGLDYYYDDEAPRPLQKKRLLEQLEVARTSKLPVILHDRDAHGDMLEIFKTTGRDLTGVFHCYSGSLETAKELLKLGFYLGFGGTSTFKNAEKVREVLKYAPLDRILLETDSPYLTPVPFRGKRNNPAYTELVARNAALLRGVTEEEIIEKTTENVKKLFFKIA